MLAASAVVAFIAAGLNSGMLSLFPPGLKQSDLLTATAQTGVMVDEPASGPSIVRKVALQQDQETLIKHAELYGRLMASSPVLERIAASAHVPADQLSGLARTTGNVPTALTEPDSERRASDIRDSQLRYRLEVQARPGTPDARHLHAGADAAAGDRARRWSDRRVARVPRFAGTRAGVRRVRCPGAPAARRAARRRRRLADAAHHRSHDVRDHVRVDGRRAVVLDSAPAAAAGCRGTPRGDPAAIEETGGDWPRTTRVLPWMLAGFIALLWLTPFHQIQLSMSMPIDMKLDRLVLPFVALLWVLALAAGGAQRAADPPDLDPRGGRRVRRARRSSASWSTRAT